MIQFNQGRVEARVSAMKRLVGEFSRKDMTVPDIATLLAMTEGGSRKYVYDLLASKIVTRAGKKKGGGTNGIMIFTITKDQSLIDDYLICLEQGVIPKAKPVPAKVAPKPRAAFRDAMVAALFGQAGGVRP